MELLTERLTIRPLTLTEFALLLKGDGALESELGLKTGVDLDEDTKIAMTGLYEKALQNPDNYLFLTNWQIIDHKLNTVVGSACFCNIPNENGEVEIGYGIHQQYQGRGYMTEAVTALCSWALNQPDVVAVVADTDKENLASHAVLKKCKMKIVSENETCFKWRLS